MVLGHASLTYPLKCGHVGGVQWKSSAEFFATGEGGAARMKPLLVSKINTGMQLALLGAALGLPAVGLGDTPHILPILM